LRLFADSSLGNTVAEAAAAGSQQKLKGGASSRDKTVTTCQSVDVQPVLWEEDANNEETVTGNVVLYGLLALDVVALVAVCTGKPTTDLAIPECGDLSHECRDWL